MFWLQGWLMTQHFDAIWHFTPGNVNTSFYPIKTFDSEIITGVWFKSKDVLWVQWSWPFFSLNVPSFVRENQFSSSNRRQKYLEKQNPESTNDSLCHPRLLKKTTQRHKVKKRQCFNSTFIILFFSALN